MSNIVCNNGSTPSPSGTLNFIYNFTHEETPNDPRSYPSGSCPYGNTGGAGCNDRVTVSTQPTQTFTCSDGVYTIAILGFYTNTDCHTSASGSASTSFITAENAVNSACLWARITAPQAITLAAFDAQWNEEQVAVTWETVSETDNLGFNLYRSTSETELGEKINGEMIPAQASGSTQGASYTYMDSSVVPGVTYWYTLEDVDTSGGTSLHGPTAAVPDVPTAITLGSLSGQGGESVPWVAAVALLAVAGAIVARRRRQP